MELGSYDNRKNHQVESDVPHISKNESCILGIDEAGRGPVLGPMVYGACYCPISKSEILKKIGFADSKTLTEEQRDELFIKLKEENNTLGWIVNILSPNFISNSMLKKNKYNLNLLSHDTAIGLIARALECGINLQEVYLDTVGDANSYQNKLSTLYPNIRIVVSKKADSIYPIVSAASICAKVARDKALREWRFIEGDMYEGLDYGSGYPGDPKTKKFLRDHLDPVFGFPQLVRFSWSTAALILQSSTVTVKWEDDDDEPVVKKNKKLEQDPKTPAISNFFQAKKTEFTKSDHNSQHKFFMDRCLKPVNKLL